MPVPGFRTLAACSTALTLAVLLLACTSRTPDTPGDAAMADSSSDSRLATRDSSWITLFDGTSLDAWRGYRMDSVPAGWQIQEGTLTRVGTGADLITRDQFGSFELELEWRLEPGGNSGIMFKVTEAEDQTYETGPEIQVLDDERHSDGGSRLTSAGAAYGLYPAPLGALKPVGEWNHVRLRVDGTHVQQWLNGTLMADYQLYSDEWKGLVAASKFKEWPGYGMAAEGHIALQDHGDPVWYRNVRIRRL
jgi:hypothetical protein